MAERKETSRAGKADDKAEHGSSRKNGAEGSRPKKLEWSKWIEMRFRALY